MTRRLYARTPEQTGKHHSEYLHSGENLQNAESRISDADVAAEMTRFVREQILTQSAVSMLSQANSVPQMLMRLLG